MSARSRRRGLWPVVVFAVVACAQLLLVGGAGTDIPYQDQWDIEGRWLYPKVRTSDFHVADLARTHNEHHLAPTLGLDVLLFRLNGQWDPLLQLVVNAFLRAAVAAILTGALISKLAGWRRPALAAAMCIAFFPPLAWGNALWGFQSQVYFVLIFSLLALRGLLDEEGGSRVWIGGLAAGVMAQWSMAAGAFVPPAVLAVMAIRIAARRAWRRHDTFAAGAATVLLASAWWLRVDVPEHAALRAHSFHDLFAALQTTLAWPHVDQPLAALILNAPLAAAALTRVLARRTAMPGEDFASGVGLWALIAAVGAAFARGGGDEFAFGIPSRYVDFFVLGTVANGWFVLAFVDQFARGVIVRPPAGSVTSVRRLLPIGALVWTVFLAVGWAGQSAEQLRKVVLPRWRTRDIPVQRVVAFQATDNPRAFDGIPRGLLPHPDLNSVRAVFRDPRMSGVLPPSLQPQQPMGPLSRATRALLVRRTGAQ